MGCIALAAQMRDVTKFRMPATREAPEPERLAYLLKQLESIEVNTTHNNRLHERSRLLKAKEDRNLRARALASGGFAVN
jgi:hypothetical protein